MLDSQFNVPYLVGTLLVTGILSTCWLVLYRLVFSPLAHFPGPKLAAATCWSVTLRLLPYYSLAKHSNRYEYYLDVVLGGQYSYRLASLHKKYGPVIRISPVELHFADPEFFDTIYASSSSGQKRDKWNWNYRWLSMPGSSVTTTGHEQHRLRRSAFGPFFSSANVRRLQPMMNKGVEKMLERMLEFRDSGNVILVEIAMAAFTNG
jgi:cytochrome P450